MCFTVQQSNSSCHRRRTDITIHLTWETPGKHNMDMFPEHTRQQSARSLRNLKMIWFDRQKFTIRGFRCNVKLSLSHTHIWECVLLTCHVKICWRTSSILTGVYRLHVDQIDTKNKVWKNISYVYFSSLIQREIVDGTVQNRSISVWRNDIITKCCSWLLRAANKLAVQNLNLHASETHHLPRAPPV